MSGLSAYAALLASGEARYLVSVPGGGALLVLAAALVLRLPALVPWGIGLCGAAYAVGLLAAEAELDPAAPLYAAGLVLAAELTYWSLEGRIGRESREVVVRRLALVLLVAVATAGLGSVVLVVADVRPVGGPMLLALGLSAAVAALTLIARLAAAASRGSLDSRR